MYVRNLSIPLMENLIFINQLFVVLGMSDFSQISLVDAQYLYNKHYPTFPPDVPAIITKFNSSELASHVKTVLRVVYPQQHAVKIIQFNNENVLDTATSYEVENLPLEGIDKSELLGDATSLFIPPLGENTSFESFQEIVAHLRAPDGCPWDKKQTHQSLREHLVSETYEVLAALDANNSEDICEEFGDLLLQIVLHAQIAAETNEFGMADVVHGIYTKIVRRHPHVFGDLNIHDVDGVLRNWENLKAKERAENGKNGENGERPKGLLEGVPLALPALIQAQEYQERVERVGFLLPDLRATLEKLQKILSNLAAMESPINSDQIGQFLYTVVGLAIKSKVDAESALREANTRLRVHISSLEEQAHNDGIKLAELAKEKQGIL
jgi:tetrapyrrole methylase family protein/MazG family protein